MELAGVALGVLADERRGRYAGPWRHNDLVAVGEVTLFNRGELEALLRAPDGEEDGACCCACWPIAARRD